MRLRSCLLHAALAVLILPSVSHAASISDNTNNTILAIECVDDGQYGPVSANGAVAGSELCLEVDPLEDAVRAFHRARAAERGQLRRMREREQRERAAERRAQRRAEAARRPSFVSPSEVRPPRLAPPAVKEVIEAANSIADTPYIWGGGHGSFESSGYDCSGAVSFALHGAGLLDASLTSSGLEDYGEPGPGRWITIYANARHTYAVIAGLRWDTSGYGDGVGPRWHDAPAYPDGYVVRHPPGY